MITPPFLKTGDRVAIVAPGARIQPGELNKAIEVMSDWHLDVILGVNIYSSRNTYLSGTDSERLSDLQDAIDDPSVRAVFCARGGYGTTRIIDSIDFSAFMKHPKWVVGFSDITALHLALESIGTESIHGIMPLLFSRPGTSKSINSLKDILFGKSVGIQADPHQQNRKGKARGLLVGGNLSLIVDSLGTPYEINTTGKILVVEEIEEYKYKIDRMLTQLKRAGKLRSLAGLVVGHMTNILDTDVPFDKDIEEIVLDKVAEYDFPVVFNFPTGHDHDNIAWRHGALSELNVFDQVELRPEGQLQ